MERICGCDCGFGAPWSVFPTEDYQAAPWHLDLTRQDEVASGNIFLPIVLPSLNIEDRCKRFTRRPRSTALHILCSFNSLTLPPADARKGGGLFIPARQAQLARSFLKANVDVIGLNECRLLVGQVCTVGTYTAV